MRAVVTLPDGRVIKIGIDGEKEIAALCTLAGPGAEVWVCVQTPASGPPAVEPQSG